MVVSNRHSHIHIINISEQCAGGSHILIYSPMFICFQLLPSSLVCLGQLNIKLQPSFDDLLDYKQLPDEALSVVLGGRNSTFSSVCDW